MASKPHVGGALKFLGCTAGIYVAYLTQGILQERLSTHRYPLRSGEGDPQQFHTVVALNFAQSVACLAWAAVYVSVFFGFGGGSTPWWMYWRAGLSNTVGPACGAIALKNISYTAQVLAKSSKMIPVMLTGTVLYGKRYSSVEYLCAFLIAGGVSVFALTKDHGSVKSKLAAPNAVLGYALVFFNLGADGYTNALQDQISEGNPQTQPQHMMCHMNLWCSVYYFIFLFIGTGNGWEAIKFCREHEDAAWDIFVFSLCGVLGQNFIFLLISSYGSVANATVTTTRKFFSICCSVFLNGSKLKPGQWAGVVMVFLGIGLQTNHKRLRAAQARAGVKKAD